MHVHYNKTSSLRNKLFSSSTSRQHENEFDVLFYVSPINYVYEYSRGTTTADRFYKGNSTREILQGKFYKGLHVTYSLKFDWVIYNKRLIRAVWLPGA